MKMLCPSRLLAATLCLTLLAGCAGSPLTSIVGSSSAKTVTSKAATPFVAASSAGLAITSTSQVSTLAAAKVLATNDEGLVESSSAALETTESAASYSVASIQDDMAAAEADSEGPVGGDRPQPLPDATAPQDGQRPGPQSPQARPGQNATTRNQGRFGGDFEMGAFGGGFDMGFEGRARQPVEPREMAHARQPKAPPKLDAEKTRKVEQRREKDQAKRRDFVKEHPQYSEDEAMIQKVLTSQPWQPTDDEGVLAKSGSATLTLGTGVSRKIAVLREVQSAKPHALVKAQTDIADVYADGASKTVHWEKVLQEDGSYSIAYHHEYTSAKGVKWVADWTKTLSADGKLTGTGTFTQTDASGQLVRKETLTIGGDDAAGQSITTATTTTTAADTTVTASPSPEASPATEETTTDAAT